MNLILSVSLLGSLGLSLVSSSPQFGRFNPFTFFNRPSRPSPTFSRPSSSSGGFFGSFNSIRGQSSVSGTSDSRLEEEYNGKTYLVSWRLGLSGFFGGSSGSGDSWCRGQRNRGKSYRAISIDDKAEEAHFKQLVARENQKYFWTGGDVRGRNIAWPSGSSYRDVEWSHTGGARPFPRAQPDNREGNEFCLGVLNNFYRDGVKFHDISCNHKKPIICEEE